MHGDEVYGVELYNNFTASHPELAKNTCLIIGNELAYQQKIRFIDADMNRQYGSPEKSHEQDEIARVDKMLGAFEPDFIIDIHTTRRNSGVFFIVDKLDDTTKKICNMLKVDIVIMLDEMAKGSLIGNYPNAVSLEYSLRAIAESTDTASVFANGLAKLVRGDTVDDNSQHVFTVSRLIAKHEWTAYKDLRNYDRKPEGIALMVPKDRSEMDAEYYGFWCQEKDSAVSIG